MMKAREPFNVYSHLVGSVATLIGLIYLISSRPTTLLGTSSFIIYGLMAMFMFTASTIYHWTSQVKYGLQKMDHCAIYLMIAGTYTPVCILGIGGQTGCIVLAVEWILATIGVVSTLTMTKPPTWLRLVLYLVMGWMILPLVGLLMNKIPITAIIWMVFGGLAYTFGTIVYASKRPKLWPGKFSSHELWHVFVVAGAVCHFAVMTYL
jgi:hemolysin III